MFDELDKKNVKNTIPLTPFVKGEIPPKTVDIFSEVDKNVKPEALKPIDNNPLSGSGTVIPANDGWLKNKGLILGLMFGGLIIVIGGGYLGLRLMVKNPAAVNMEIKKEEANNPVAPETAVPEVTLPAGEINQPILTQPVDSDQDGLTDEEETVAGTSLNSPDSDQDGLTDREEAKVFSTDPLRADTDDDGYVDGDEIKNGFNPNGPGKLLDINDQMQ
ncbi:hypothetical protein HY797_01450 [Candidatus Falkowbacteria bacterium]|nr:hypothetical protein [Candidatus Falkowbacteria bacterium]